MGEVRARSWWIWPLAAWSAVFTGLLLVQLLARRIAPAKSPELLAGWVQFDGPEYLSIAADGYARRQLVWFPAYPLAIRAVDRLLDDPLVSAVLVSALAGLTATLLFWVWVGDRRILGQARIWALAAMLLFPYGWFLYGVVYSDALFLAAALAAFVLVERKRYLLAAVAGSVATACRPSGLAVVAGLTVLAFERAELLRPPGPWAGWVHQLRIPVGLDRSRWSPRLLIPALSVAGLLAVMVYQWRWWGSPLAFVSEQSNYHEGGIGSLVKQQYFEAWNQGFDGRHLATTTAQGVLLVAVLASVPAVGRRFGWGYAVYVFGLALLPAVSVSTFMGSGRYLLPAFPTFALLGEWMARRRTIGAVMLGASAALLVLMAGGFARSWYLT